MVCTGWNFNRLAKLSNLIVGPEWMSFIVLHVVVFIWWVSGELGIVPLPLQKGVVLPP